MKKFDLKLIFSLTAAILVVYLTTHYWPNISEVISSIISAATPIIFGFVLAYPINILMSFYERHFFPKKQSKSFLKVRKGVCLVSAVVSIIGVIALVTVLVAPQFVACIKMLFAKIPPTVNFVVTKLKENEFLSKNVVSALSELDWQSKLADMAGTLAEGVGNTVGVAVSAISSVFTTLANLVITVIFSVYVLVERERLLRQLKKVSEHYLPERLFAKLNQICTVLNESFRSFIVGQCLEAVILGVLCTVGMYILKIPYAPMIGALMGFTALIPIFGGLIGAGIGAFLILMDSPIKALIFIVFVIILQQIEGNFIYPKVVGNSTGLPGLWVLAAVTIGGGVSGILGMLIAVPIAATIYKLVRTDVDNKNKKSRWDLLSVPDKNKTEEKEEQLQK